ncbi:MAG: kynureninase [Gammaproteobacteria bacterium]|nr:kynureninase [Gammaproteobacteria bacterium]MDE1886626.1 kynureninase [Gammaproteobacteria bacterium]MDE2023933.1 kynureninase [Gammaproteobacteria bacterium]
MSFRADAAFATHLDQDDPLAHYRDKFHIPHYAEGEEIYLCGNSLGLQPKTVERFLREELEDWQRLAVKAHFAGRRPWMPYHELLTAKTAHLVGAELQEVVNMNSLTANLHLMLVSFYRPTQARHRILIERGAFPSDRYALASQLRFHGFDPGVNLVELAPQKGRATLNTGEIEAAIRAEGEQLALVLLPGVQYYSGQAFDIERLARAAHSAGAVAGFDLAHAAGNLPLKLHNWNVDFAVWCSYKYLNAGPGAVAGCFVHARHACVFDGPRFAGWWGHDKTTRFRMHPEFVPMEGAEGWQLSNPPILALAPLLASLEIFEEAGMQGLREKSLRLTGYLEFLLDLRLADEVEILTPRNPAERGCQLSLRLRGSTQRAREVFRQLEAHGVTADWREPDVIRVAPVPLYNTYTDVYRFVDLLKAVLRAGK